MAGVKFTEAIDFLRHRLELGPDEWEAQVREADAAARTWSAGMSDALIQDILDAVLAALEEGTTARDFSKSFDALTRTHGWEGNNKGGWRAALTFRTLTAQAMAAGRWAQIQKGKKTYPYIRYVTAGDHRVRKAHQQWQGLILHCDDPFWDTHFPPNGFNCRCHVQSISDYELKRYGWQVAAKAPEAATEIKFVRVDGVMKPVETPAGVDPGFGFNPGKLGLKDRGK